MECGLQGGLGRRDAQNYNGGAKSRKRPLTESEGGTPNVMVANWALGSECDTGELLKRLGNSLLIAVVITVALAVAVGRSLLKCLNRVVIESVSPDDDSTTDTKTFLQDDSCDTWKPPSVILISLPQYSM